LRHSVSKSRKAYDQNEARRTLQFASKLNSAKQHKNFLSLTTRQHVTLVFLYILVVLKLDTRFDGNKFEPVTSDDLVYTTHGKHQGILDALSEGYRRVYEGESCFILLKDALPPYSGKI